MVKRHPLAWMLWHENLVDFARRKNLFQFVHETCSEKGFRENCQCGTICYEMQSVTFNVENTTLKYDSNHTQER